MTQKITIDELIKEMKNDQKGKSLAGQALEEILLDSDYELELVTWELARDLIIDFLEQYQFRRALDEGNN